MFFFLPCNCFVTFFQILKCASSIVVLLDVFGLPSFLANRRIIILSISLNATQFLKKMGYMPIGIDMVAYVKNMLVDGASIKFISNAMQINDFKQL